MVQYKMLGNEGLDFMCGVEIQNHFEILKFNNFEKYIKTHHSKKLYE